MKEIFIISEKATGFIKSSGRIDKSWDLENTDGSTVSERIETILSENSNLEVLYLKSQDLPKQSEYKINSGEVVLLSVEEKKSIEDSKPKSKIEELEDRVLALESN